MGVQISCTGAKKKGEIRMNMNDIIDNGLTIGISMWIAMFVGVSAYGVPGALAGLAVGLVVGVGLVKIITLFP